MKKVLTLTFLPQDVASPSLAAVSLFPPALFSLILAVLGALFVDQFSLELVS